MRPLFELFEMVSLNQGILTAAEKAEILKASLAIAMFERAMRAFRDQPAKAAAMKAAG